MKGQIPVILCLAGAALLLFPGFLEQPTANVPDIISQTFDVYERMHRELSGRTADKIGSGELKTEQEVWNYLNEGSKIADRTAKQPLAEFEGGLLNKEWAADLHREILQGYQSGRWTEAEARAFEEAMRKKREQGR